MKVRMIRYVESFVLVRDLRPGEVIELPEAAATQFLDNGMAVPLDGRAERDERLEAAALTPARRRG